MQRRRWSLGELQPALPYRPLPTTPTAFRLLLLDPGTLDDVIECHLLVADLGIKYHYEALSYAWGDPQDTLPIILDSIRRYVTVNLEIALRRLRFKHSSRVIWVDALCINQNDIREREGQVRRMRDIYKSSSRTLVWLGEPPPNFGGEGGITGVKDFLVRSARSARDGSNMDPPPPGTAHEAFRLADAFWFDRIWVLQEMALGKEVTMICGEIDFPWSDFVEGLSAVGNTDDASHTTRSLNRWHEGRIRAAKFCREYTQNEVSRSKWLQTPIADRLLALLLASNGLQSSDPRDHIFALLGLVDSPEKQTMEPRLAVDYEAPVGQILKRVAIYLFESTRDPSILYGAGSTPTQRQLGIPSWVPTWQSYRGYSLQNYFNFELPIWRAPEDPTGDVAVSESQDTLTLRGQIQCRVTRVGSTAVGASSPTRESSNIFRQRIEHARSLFTSWEQDILDPLEQGYSQAWAISVLGSPIRDDPALLAACSQSMPPEDVRGAWEEALFHQRGIEEAYNGFDHYLYSVLMGRATNPFNNSGVGLTLFVTLELGRLEGGAPFATSNGLFGFFSAAHLLREEISNAFVCLFQGCRTPFIVRGNNGLYTLLGPCYMAPYIELVWNGPFKDMITLI